MIPRIYSKLSSSSRPNNYSIFKCSTIISIQKRSYGAKVYQADPYGPNYGLIRTLEQEMQDERNKPGGNPYKIRVFSGAIKILDQLEGPVLSADEAKKIKGIGPGIARRIEEYLSSSAGEVKPRIKSPEEIALQELQKVHGIGPAKARTLYAAGCRTLDDLKKPEFVSKLPASSRTSLEFVGDLESPVTRSQAEKARASVEAALGDKYEVVLAGSYRRRVENLSDIDIVVFYEDNYVEPPAEPPYAISTSSSTSSPSSSSSSSPSSKTKRATKTKTSKSNPRTEQFLSDVIEPLRDAGVISGTLSCGQRKWQGIVRIAVPSPDGNEVGTTYAFRRMDISYSPKLSKGAALLALTGDSEFNRQMRLSAQRLGMLLNESGLWAWRYAGKDSDSDSDSDSDVVGRVGVMKAKTVEDASISTASMSSEHSVPPQRTDLATQSSLLRSSLSSSSTTTTTSDPETKKPHPFSPSSSASNSNSNSKSKQNQKTQDQGHWEIIESEAEDKILTSLGIGPVDPARRNFAYVFEHKLGGGGAGRGVGFGPGFGFGGGGGARSGSSGGRAGSGVKKVGFGRPKARV